MENVLYYGDNLDILRRHLKKDESVDLIYLDPPFKSNQNYNVLFKEKDGTRAASQIQAFEDTWTWDQEDEAVYADLVTAGGKVADVLQAFRTFLGPCDMLAYLVMMAPRLVEMRRVLKSTGSIYLHCDPAASHYLKMLMDAVFGPERFLNEIIWQRTTSKGLMTRRLSRNHDVILSYQLGDNATWNLDETFKPYDIDNLDDKTESKYRLRDADGRLYQLDNLINPNPDRPNLTYEFLGVTKVWRWTKARMEEAYRKGLVVQPGPGKVPRLKRYLDEQRGKPFGDVWTDIFPINSQAAERLGYPTQKPQSLLERIIRMSSNDGDLVLDPFCGCGTTIAAAQRLNRQWIGIDITFLAMTLMKERLRDAFGESGQFKVVGEPVSVPDAAALAASEPYQFQWWALGLVGARPVEGKKGADKGIDGKIVFKADAAGKFETVILSVKAGHVTANHVRDLRGVVEREKAAIGVLISMEDPTKPMQTEAVTAGFHESPMWNRKYPKIQLLTVADLLDGKKIDMPPVRQVGATFKKAPKASQKRVETGELPLVEDGE
jgi:site-specific DNA-methyltransferase (adenine-specific)